MAKQSFKTAVGAFVIGGLALLVAGIILLGGGRMFSDDIEYVLYFDGSVSGLNIGAPVVFRGVPMGQVTRISLEANPRDASVTIPVYIRLDENSIVRAGVTGELTDNFRQEILRRLIQRGLRARLQLQSLITGQYRVELDFLPNTPANFRSPMPDREIPTLPSPIDTLQRTVASLPLEEMAHTTAGILEKLNAALSGDALERGIKAFATSFEEAQALLAGMQEDPGPGPGKAECGGHVGPARSAPGPAKHPGRHEQRLLRFPGHQGRGGTQCPPHPGAAPPDPGKRGCRPLPAGVHGRAGTQSRSPAPRQTRKSPMNHLLRHTTVFLALLTLLLTACGRSAPTHFYLLDSGQPPLTADSLPAASLSIAPVSVPDYLDRNGLVRRSDGQTRLEVSELDIWAEPLGQGARRVLGEVLAARLLPRGIDVIAAGDRQGDMELAVALERLDGDTPGTARLQARWQLSRGGEALDRGIYAASEDAGMSSASLVAAQSRLLQGLGEHLADRLLPRLKAGR